MALHRDALGGDVVTLTHAIKKRTTREIAQLFEDKFNLLHEQSKTKSPYIQGSIPYMSTQNQVKAMQCHLEGLNTVFNGFLYTDKDSKGEILNSILYHSKLPYDPAKQERVLELCINNCIVLDWSVEEGKRLESDNIQMPITTRRIQLFVESDDAGVMCVFINTHFPKPTNVCHTQVYVFTSTTKNEGTGILFDPLDPEKQVKEANAVLPMLHQEFRDHLETEINGLDFKTSVAPPVQTNGDAGVAGAMLYAAFAILGGTDSTFALMLLMLRNGKYKLKPENVVACYANAVALGLGSRLLNDNFLDPPLDPFLPQDHHDSGYTKPQSRVHTHSSYTSTISATALVFPSNIVLTCLCAHSVGHREAQVVLDVLAHHY